MKSTSKKKELQQQLESAKAQMAESRSELAELRRASSEQKQDAARLVSECEAHKDEVGILKQAKHQAAAQLAALTQQLLQGKEHERRFEGEILVLSDAKKSLETQLKEARASLQALKADLARREGARAAAQRRLRAFPEMVQAVQADRCLPILPTAIIQVDMSYVLHSSSTFFLPGTARGPRRLKLLNE